MKGKEKTSNFVVGSLRGCTGDKEKIGPSPCQKIAKDLPQVKEVTFDESKSCNLLRDSSDRKLCERVRELQKNDKVPQEVIEEIFREYFEGKSEGLR